MTGISFIDSTPIEVCHPCRAKNHKVFGDLPKWGKNSVGWYYGFKLHLIVNDQGELLSFQLTAGNTDERKPVPDLTSDPADFQSAKERASVDSVHFWQVIWRQGVHL